MDLLVFSPPHRAKDEIEILHAMFENGLQVYHLRKPGYSAERLANFIESIHEEFRQNIVLHHHFDLSHKYGLRGTHFGKLSRNTGLRDRLKLKMLRLRYGNQKIGVTFHHPHAYQALVNSCDYAILSPVFDSISSSVKAEFKPQAMQEMAAVWHKKLIAYGGVDESNLHEAAELGFAGVALQGAIWKNKYPLDTFMAISEAVRGTGKGKASISC